MIDFKNASYVKLMRTNGFANEKIVAPIMVPGEQFIGEYKSVRDFVVFTDKRIIAVNVQGVTGKKRDMTSLPYSKCQAFSVETAGHFDLDSELELYYSGVGKIVFEFLGNSDIIEIARVIAQRVL